MKELRGIVCAYCHEFKRLTWPGEVKKRRYCSQICANKHMGSLMRGKTPTLAASARRAQADARAQRRARETFGELTTREIAIWRLGEVRGYSVGYNKAYAALGKQVA